MSAQAAKNVSNNVHPFPTQQGKKSVIDHPGFSLEGALDTAVMTARAFPRDINHCIKNIDLTISMSPEVAASCYYTLARKNKQNNEIITITGPSIRLAEICASFWGNVQSGTRVISNNGKSVVVEGWCLDLETNSKVSHEVSRGIVTKSGYTYSEDMQNVTIAAASAIAFRNVVFKTIPKVFIDQALKKAMKVAVDAKDFETRRQAMFDLLERLGIPTERVFAFFDKSSIQEFTVEDMKVIAGIRTSIKDKLIKPEEAFVLCESRASEIANKIMDDEDDVQQEEHYDESNDEPLP